MFLCPDYFTKFGEIGGQVIALLSNRLHDESILILLICLLSREYRYTHLQCLHGALQLVNHRMHKVASHLIHLLLQEHHLDEISYAQEKHDGNQQTSYHLPHHSNRKEERMASSQTCLILLFISFFFFRCKGTKISLYIIKVKQDYFASVMFQ